MAPITKHRYAQFSGAPPPSNDFVANGDGTVTDTSTESNVATRGLIWDKWQGALSYCENLNLAGHNDWRLPNRNELFTILKLGLGPFIDEVYFPATSPSRYMASTTNLNVALSTAWGVDFSGWFRF